MSIQKTSTMLERLGGSVQLLTQITDLFLQNWERDYQRLESALRACDQALVLHALLHLKVSLGYFADDEILTTVDELMDTVKHPKGEPEQRVIRLKAELRQLACKLKELRGTLHRRAVA